jgi:hypothetical protein
LHIINLFTTCSKQQNIFHHHLHAFLITVDNQPGEQCPHCVCSHTLWGVLSLFVLHHLWLIIAHVAYCAMVKHCMWGLTSCHVKTNLLSCED